MLLTPPPASLTATTVPLNSPAVTLPECPCIVRQAVVSLRPLHSASMSQLKGPVCADSSPSPHPRARA